MISSAVMTSIVIWIGIAFCLTQSAIFSGLNLAIFSISRLRLEVDVAGGNAEASGLLDLRRESNQTLSTVLWGNVGVNVLLAQLSDSVLAGVWAFAFSTVVITLFGEIVPQAYFSRNAVRMAMRFAPLLKVYAVVLFPVARPTAFVLNWWLGPEGIPYLREQDFRAFITTHVGVAGTGIGKVEATGALNFLDLDDIAVLDEGEPVDPRSIVDLPMHREKLVLPHFKCSPQDPFLRQLAASDKKWVIFVDNYGWPQYVMDSHHFLRDALFNQIPVDPVKYWHRPIVVSDPRTPLGEVMGRMQVKPEHVEDDVIDHDLILVWGEYKRVITGADLLGRLLRGIVTTEVKPAVG